jgi:hypothetical protein
MNELIFEGNHFVFSVEKGTPGGLVMSCNLDGPNSKFTSSKITIVIN